MSLFGHHHSAPTIVSRLTDAAAAFAHVPLAVWLTIIPIAGGLAIAYVTHRLNLSRDRIALRREDARRRSDDERTATRARADLSFRLARHREALRAAARGDVARLESEHEALVRRAAETDVIEVLGSAYVPFMAVLQREQNLVAVLSARDTDVRVDSAQRAVLDELDAAFETYAQIFALPGTPAALKASR